jgi:cytochrome bd-type quinol oxidase subunit 2
MPDSDATVANANTASETLSFILIIAVMAILLIRT